MFDGRDCVLPSQIDPANTAVPRPWHARLCVVREDCIMADCIIEEGNWGENGRSPAAHNIVERQ